MMFKVAFRNIFRQKRRTILTLLTMLGGFFLSAFSIALSDGGYARVIEMFTRNQLGHIQIHANGYLDRPSLYKTVDNYKETSRKIETCEGVQFYTPRVFSAGLASVGEKSTGVRIIGIDPERENIATNFDKKIINGHPMKHLPAHEAILGQGLANNLKASVGDEIVIVSQGADGSIANDLYTISGLISSGNKLSDQSTFYLHLADAQELLVLNERVHEIAIIADELDEVEDLKLDIVASIDNPSLSVETWKEFARSFYRAMLADQQGTWIMLAIIIVVVAVGVLNTVLMTVLERRREYGVLRALGTAPIQVFRLVLQEVGIMAVIGIIIGAIISLVMNYWLSFEGIYMGQSFTYGGMEFSHMYTEINARSFYIPGICVLVSALLVSLFPAVKAARVPPARAMRMH